MVVGIIIGASIFVQPSEINRHVPSDSGRAGGVAGGGNPDAVRFAGVRRIVVGVSAHRRRLRVPERDALAGMRIPVGMGHVLERALRHHRGIVDDFRALRGLLRPAGRFRNPRRGDRRHSGALLRSTTWECARAACCKRWSPAERLWPSRCCCSWWPSSAHRAAHSAAPQAAPASFPRVRAGSERGAIRVRRMAHGHLHGGRNARPGQDHPAGAADRLAGGHHGLRSAERRVSLPAAPRQSHVLHARGRRRGFRHGRRARRRADFGAGDALRGGRI